MRTPKNPGDILMDKYDIDQAAGLLLEARTRGTLLTALPASSLPPDLSGAYAIQDAVSEALGAVGGWKVGAKGPDAEPTCAPMPASLMHAAPYALAPPLVGESGIEGEIAVRMKHDLPAREQPYLREEVIAAIGSVHPAIEIVTYRFTDHAAQPRMALVADALGNGAFVYGEGRAMAVELDQTQQQVVLRIDDETRVDTVGGNTAGDIFRLVTWLANHLAQRCGGLRAGQFVTTGTCTGLIFVEAGSKVEVTFAELGNVALDIRER